MATVQTSINTPSSTPVDSSGDEMALKDTKGVSIKKPKKPSLSIEDILPSLQQQKMETKFEIKKELTNAITAQANSLMSIDPATATALHAIATAFNTSVTANIALGENQEFNAQQPIDDSVSDNAISQSSAKTNIQAKQADSLEEHLFNETINFLRYKDYFEKNENNDQEKVAEDISNTVMIMTIGLEKIAEECQIDFNDENTWDAITEMIYDGTLYNKGKNIIQETYEDEE